MKKLALNLDSLKVQSFAVTEKDEDARGTVIGLAEDSLYRRGTARLEPDDLVVFYSDGVTDRGGAEGELYGLERLKEAALRSRADTARIVLYSLLGDVQGWSAGTPAEDDSTLIVAKFRGLAGDRL